LPYVTTERPRPDVAPPKGDDCLVISVPRRVGLDYAMKEGFFLEYKARLVSELKKHKMGFEVVF